MIRRTLSVMGTRRSVVDYGLSRRATLTSVYAGRTTVTDVCDAHPYLLRAAKFHGEPTEDRCPICRTTKLTHVTYVYGDEPGQYGRRGVPETRETPRGVERGLPQPPTSEPQASTREQQS